MASTTGSEIHFEPYLLDRIAKGEAVLFLGSGASLDASNPHGNKAPTSTKLRDDLCDEFLGKQAKDKSLAAVGDLVKNQAGIVAMQSFIAEKLENLRPTSAHSIIPKFRWKAIVTTNYDLLIEDAYRRCSDPLQLCKPIISDDDQIGPVISNPAKFTPLLKLHGCITRKSDTDLPLILSSWEYSKFKHRRERLFGYLKDWGREYPILFCGYSVGDENIRDILFELSDPSISRPQYAMVNKNILNIEHNLWLERRIDAQSGTFDGLMTYLNSAISAATRVLGAAFKGRASSLSRFIPDNETPSNELNTYLQNELTHIHPGMAVEAIRPDIFYRGGSDAWGWAPAGFDVARQITDELILNVIIENENRRQVPQLHLLLGYAGSGKSVVLKRFSWRASEEYSKPIFFLQEGGTLEWDKIAELYALIRDTVFIVVDDVLQHAGEIESVLKNADRLKVPLVILGGARANEWNIEGANLAPLVKQPYDLLDLTSAEIGELVARLRKYNCLGYMSDYSDSEAIEYFRSKLDQQLLVALHEATSGMSFAETIANEYTNVVPSQAQRLYLDICTVHRVGVAVRAGTISRVTGIRLEEFNKRLFKPLEHVVHTELDQRVGDYVYKARHPKIAAMVFEAATSSVGARSNQLVRLIGKMNAGYTTDEKAIVKLIRAKDLAKDFSEDKTLAYPVLHAARLAGISEEAFYQHLAQFELLHRSGDVKKAYALIDQAASSSKNASKSTFHVKAMILRRMANDATLSVERDKRRQEARLILDRLMADKRDPHPYNTKASLLLDELSERLNDEVESEKLVAELVKEVQMVLVSSRQLFPRDSFIASIEARFADVMNQHPRAVAVLERAHKEEPHSQYVALQLAEKFRAEGRLDNAITVLQETLKAGGPNKEIHLALAESLIAQDQRANAQRISTHLRSSFHDGEPRFHARYLYARHEFLFGNREHGEAEFEKLKNERIRPESATQIRDFILAPDGHPQKFSGDISAILESFAFVRCDQLACDVFVHATAMSKETWHALRNGSRINFEVGFSLKGPVAANVQIIS